MNKLKGTGVAIAISAATLFLTTPVFASASDAATDRVPCAGVNSCKGQSSCNTATNSCKGQNSCKGKGVLVMTQAECQKAGGTVNNQAPPKSSNSSESNSSSGSKSD